MDKKYEQLERNILELSESKDITEAIKEWEFIDKFLEMEKLDHHGIQGIIAKILENVFVDRKGLKHVYLYFNLKTLETISLGSSCKDIMEKQHKFQNTNKALNINLKNSLKKEIMRK